MSNPERCRQRVRSLFEEGRFGDVVDFLSGQESLLELSADELVAKGRAILLSPEEANHALDEAEKCFLVAVQREADYVPALLELGWYHYAVMDDASAALPFFQRALGLTQKVLTEAARGYAGCLSETDSEVAAREFLQRIHALALLVEELGEEERRWFDSRLGSG